MSTNPTVDSKPTNPAPASSTTPTTLPQQAIPKVIVVMQSVKTNTPEAKLNETSINDGKGGRIVMDDHTKTQTFKGVEPLGGQVFRGVEQDKPNK